MNKKHIKKELLPAINIYKELIDLSHQISDLIWELVQFWPMFSQDVVGKKLIFHIDQIGILLTIANEDKKQRQKIIYKSWQENILALAWLDRARRHKLLQRPDYQKTYTNLQTLKRELGKLIQTTGAVIK